MFSRKVWKVYERALSIAKSQNKEFILLTAWNEWGEGAMLEPSEKEGYRYLTELKKAVESQ